MEEVKTFLKKHQACDDGLQWAVANCKTMQEVWDKAKPEWLVWLATRKGVLPEKDLHRFACWSVRQVWHLLTDERSKNAVIVKERWIEGEATDEDARAAAWDARDAAWDAWAAAWDARDAAWAAAWAAAWDAAGDAARDAWAAAWDARAAQANHIRSTYKPTFEAT